jgi:hypothetical protein
MKFLCSTVLTAVVGAGAALAEEAPEQLEMADTECNEVIAKTANGEPLTPKEGDLLLTCFTFPPFDPDDPSGWQANHPPDSLYNDRDFIDVPGVLGGGMVQG